MVATCYCIGNNPLINTDDSSLTYSGSRKMLDLIIVFVISNRGRLLGIADLIITKPIKRNDERRNNEDLMCNIRCDNGIEFKNYAMNEFCAKKGIKREFSIARTPQQNGVAERKNRTLIEAARTMLADSLLPIPFWEEEVNTACYANLMENLMKVICLDTLPLVKPLEYTTKGPKG
ncbi:putative ribonuclease H-like domain-containing protein [Tanacetum coccineum]